MPAPPFNVSPDVLNLVVSIERLIGRLEGSGASRPQPMLRKRNRVRTIHATTAIEGNTLSFKDVTAFVGGQRIAGSLREIREIENAVAAYDCAPSLSFTSERDLLSAHRTLMRGLAADAGRFRTQNVGVWHGARVAHVAPQPARVQPLVRSLLTWARRAPEPRLLVACVVHYELQFIHPFSDGNGRIGRLWQHVGLLPGSDVFSFVPVESLIRDRQQRYYSALRESDIRGECTPFLDFSLRTLHAALKELEESVRPQPESTEDRLSRAQQTFGQSWFSRADYLRVHPRLSTATASRDLQTGVESAALIRQGDKRLARYRFRRRA